MSTTLSSTFDTSPQKVETTHLPGRFLVLHLLRPVAGVNLNAGDGGAPKQIVVGGARRMRVSSQSQKRAMRTWATTFIADAEQAARTRRVPDETAKVLVTDYGREKDKALRATAALLTTVLKVNLVKIDQTNATAFVPAATPRLLAAVVNEHWDTLAAAWSTIETTHNEAVKAAVTDGKRKRKSDEESALPKATGIPTTATKQAAAAFNPGANIEIALYGRFLSELPGKDRQIDGAVAVGHAYSVDPVALVTDQWSAKDDWQDGGVFGSTAHYSKDGTVLGSGTLYQWAALDRAQLRTNLADGGLTGTDLDDACADAERLFVAAAIWSLPSANQHTTAATPPALAAVLAGDTAPLGLPCYTEPVADDVFKTAANRMADYLVRTNRRMPVNGGVVLWMPPVDSPAPVFPQKIMVEAS